VKTYFKSTPVSIFHVRSLLFYVSRRRSYPFLVDRPINKSHC